MELVQGTTVVVQQLYYYDWYYSSTDELQTVYVQTGTHSHNHRYRRWHVRVQTVHKPRGQGMNLPVRSLIDMIGDDVL